MMKPLIFSIAVAVCGCKMYDPALLGSEGKQATPLTDASAGSGPGPVDTGTDPWEPQRDSGGSCLDPWDGTCDAAPTPPPVPEAGAGGTPSAGTGGGGSGGTEPCQDLEGRSESLVQARTGAKCTSALRSANDGAAVSCGDGFYAVPHRGAGEVELLKTVPNKLAPAKFGTVTCDLAMCRDACTYTGQVLAEEDAGTSGGSAGAAGQPPLDPWQ